MLTHPLQEKKGEREKKRISKRERVHGRKKTREKSGHRWALSLICMNADWWRERKKITEFSNSFFSRESDRNDTKKSRADR
jgi:hypothetical protein